MTSYENVYSRATLRTGFVPDESQSKVIRKLIEEGEKTWTGITGRILELEDELRTLASQLSQIDETISIHKSLVSPVRRLMPELLLKIFEYCVDSEKFSFNDSAEAPLVLTHVCQRWREHAVGFSCLWTQIDIQSSNDPTATAPPVALWLKRSGSLPLKLCVKMDRPMEIWNMAKSVINSEFERCAQIDLTTTFTLFCDVFPEDMVVKSMTLKTLSFSCKTRTPHPFSPTQLWRLPRLEILILTNASFLLQAIIPTASLRKLRVRRGQATTIESRAAISHSVWYSLLKSCMRLEELDMDMADVTQAGDGDENIEILESIDCPYLRRLKVRLGTSCGPTETFPINMIQAPALQHISLDGEKWCLGNSIYSALYNLVVGCQPVLRRLSLKYIDFPSEKSLALLQLLNAVERMKISSGGLLRTLVPSRDAHPSTWLCPNLMTLKLICDCGANEDFVSLLERRAPPEDTGHRLPTRGASTIYLRRIYVTIRHETVWLTNARIVYALKHLQRTRGDLVIQGMDRFINS